ncbi:MAG: 50S ribosomal protein L31 [Nitrosopumilus sp.]|nr:50S ribosomal protein L31 [Nitrosopumilus sp.]
MSQELERVYTIPLGKVLISQSQHRAVRAINMIKEFAQHHMKVEIIKIDEELAHKIWSRGVRSPPRKIKVRMSKTDEGYVLVSLFTDDAESTVTEKETKKVEDSAETAKEAPAKEAPAKEAPAKETPAKETPAKETPAKETPKTKSN